MNQIYLFHQMNNSTLTELLWRRLAKATIPPNHSSTPGIIRIDAQQPFDDQDDDNNDYDFDDGIMEDLVPPTAISAIASSTSTAFHFQSFLWGASAVGSCVGFCFLGK